MRASAGSASVARLRRALAVLLSVSLLLGCAASNRVLAERRDYRMYRDFRLAQSVERKLMRANRYLRESQSGRFRPQVTAWFETHEPKFFEIARSRPSLLRAYLGALPDGPHAEEAIDRLIELSLLREYRDGQEQREEQKLGSVLNQLERAAAERTRLVETFTELAELLAKTRSFGQPTAELHDRLLFVIRLQPPPMRCAEDRCLKQFSLSYSVPEAGRLSSRTAPIELELELERGLLQGLTLSGLQLFDRLYEASSLQPVAAGDFTARVEALARSAELLENAIEAGLPRARCHKDPRAPQILWRACDGVQLEVIAATSSAEKDVLSVRPWYPSVPTRGAGQQ